MKRGFALFSLTLLGLLTARYVSGQTWEKCTAVPTNRLGSIVIDSHDAVFVSTESDGIFMSRNDGDTWTRLWFSDQPMWDYNVFYVKATDCVFVTAASGNLVFRSCDSGLSWQQLAVPWTSYARSVAGNSNGDLFVGTNSGQVWRSTDSGRSWSLASDGIEAQVISPMLVDNEGRVFVGTRGWDTSYGGAVFRSVDNGTTWQRVLGDVGPVTVFTMTSTGTILVGTDSLSFTGVFRTVDGGGTWTAANDGLPNPRTYGLAVDNDDNAYVAIFGTGVYRSADGGASWQSASSGLDHATSWYTMLAANSRNRVFVTTIPGGQIYRTKALGGNSAPTANAGPDFASEAGTPVRLDGSRSSDPDGDTLTYTWTGDFPDGAGTVTGVAPIVTLPLGQWIVTLTVDDGHGHQTATSVTVTVRDTTPPVLSLPTGVSVESDGPQGAVVTFTASAIDAMAGPVTVTCLPASGSRFQSGTTTVSCTASDQAGNTVQGSFVVIVQDPHTIFERTGIRVAENTKAIVADLNSDGHNDVIADRVYLNDGTGILVGHDDAVNTTSRSPEVGYSVGDLDNDGDLDFVRCGGYRCQVLLNDGTGHFGLSGTYPITSGGYAYDCRVADFNNDGFVDIAVNSHGYLYAAQVLWNQKDGSFVAGDVGPYGVSVGVDASDFNNDGSFDLLWTNNGYSALVMANDGAGHFGYSNWLLPFSGASGTQNNFVDLNADGLPDVIVNQGGSHYRYRNDGNGAFGRMDGTVEGSPLRAGDVDNDGDDDCYPNFINDGQGNLTASNESWALFYGLGDLTGQGYVDSVGADGWLYRNRTFLTKGRNLPPTTPGALTAVAKSDSIDFAWTPAVDDVTPQAMVTYNLRVGTRPGGNELMSGVTPGWWPNTQHNTHWTLNVDMSKHCEVYWSVQAQDGSLVRSPWASDEIVLGEGCPPPSAVAGPDQVLEATSPSGAVVVLDGSASRGANGQTITFRWTLGDQNIGTGSVATTTAPLGDNTYTLTVEDQHGLKSAASATVKVRDTTPPTLTLPTSVAVDAASAAGTVVTFAASARDMVSGDVPVTCAPRSGVVFPLGTTVVNCLATDAAGNTATGAFRVTVREQVTVQLIDSYGSPISGGVVHYYSGSWLPFGTTGPDGRVSLALPLRSYTFRMTLGGGVQDIAQNTSTNSVVTYRTTKVTVQLKNSSGAPLDSGTVQYYAGSWRAAGSTASGQVSLELLPVSYTFRMSYAGGIQDKSQNTATGATVVFQTAAVAVQLKSSLGAPVDTATVQYYAGTWRPFGVTAGGEVRLELLPGSYTFRMIYAGGVQDRAQSVTPGVVVGFVTAPVHSDSGGCTSYYAGSWRPFVQEMELLPAAYVFRFVGSSDTSYTVVPGITNHIR